MLNLIDGLAPLGVEMMVIIPHDGQISVELQKRGVLFFQYKFYYWSSLWPVCKSNIFEYLKKLFIHFKVVRAREKQNRNAVVEIVNELKTFGPQIIYTNSSVINVGFQVSRKMGIDHVWHLREFGKEDYNLSFNYSRKKVKKQFDESSSIIGISDAVCNYYKSYTDNHIHKIYNGVISSEELKGARNVRNNKSDDYVVFGIIGVLHPNKGQEEAIRAFKEVVEKYEKCRLLIAGGGEFQRQLVRLVAELKVDHVEFLGFVKDPFEFYAQIDVALVCSKHEAFGRVTVEAMACSLPVIGYSNAGTLELIEEQETGFFYKDGVPDLAEKMVRMVSHPELRERFGERASKIVQKKYTTEFYAESVYKVLKDMIVV